MRQTLGTVNLVPSAHPWPTASRELPAWPRPRFAFVRRARIPEFRIHLAALLPKELNRFFLGERGGEDVIPDLEVSGHVFLELLRVAAPFHHLACMLRP